MNIDKLIEEFAKMYEKGDIQPSDLIDAGLSIESIRRINEIHGQLQVKKNRELATSSLKSFILYREEDYDMHWHHEMICDSIEDFLRPENPTEILVLEAPPRSGKSQIVSRNLPAYYLGKYPDNAVVFATYASDLAKKMNRDVQRIMDNQIYLELFPESKLNSSNIRSTAKGNYIRTTDMFEIVGKQGSYKSVGQGGPLTGFGYNLGIIDDIVKDFEAANSPVVSEAIWNWFESVFYTRKAKKAKIIIMMTRWKQNDLIGRIIENEKKNKTGKVEVLSFPMLYDDSLDKINPLDIRTKKNEPLWPNRFPIEECLSIKQMLGSKIWTSMYQQNPVPEGGSIINRGWFKFYRELPDFEYTTLSLDCAFKDTDKSDYVVFGIWGIKGKNKYLLHVVRDRMSFNTTLATIYALVVRFKGLTELIIEAKANGDAIISALNSNPKITIPIYPFTPTSSKESRAASVAPQLEAGQVWLPDTSYERNMDKEWVESFIEEVSGFPNMKNDDQLDMMVQTLIRVSNSTMGWMEGIIEGDSIVSSGNVSDTVEYLSKKMGWSTLTGSGLDF